MSLSVELSVIVPCYNPADDWVENIIQHFSKVKSEIASVELVIVNDGSTKNFDAKTYDKLYAAFPEVRIVTNDINCGKGFALRKGIELAKGELIIYTDVDFPYSDKSFINIYNALKIDNEDVAIGIRGEEYYTHVHQARVRISKLFRWFVKRFLHLPTDDTQCGLKGMNQKGREVFLQTTIDRYLFDLEFIFLATKQKLLIKTVEVELRPEIQLSKMSWKILLQELGNFLKIFVRSI